MATFTISADNGDVNFDPAVNRWEFDANEQLTFESKEAAFVIEIVLVDNTGKMTQIDADNSPFVAKDTVIRGERDNDEVWRATRTMKGAPPDVGGDGVAARYRLLVTLATAEPQVHWSTRMFADWKVGHDR